LFTKRIVLALLIAALLVGITGCGQTTGKTALTSNVMSTSIPTIITNTGNTSTPDTAIVGTTPVSTTVNTIPGYTITVQDAKNILDTDKTAVFIDVRAQTAFDNNHIPGAVLIPVTEISDRLSEIPRDKQVVVYAQCH